MQAKYLAAFCAIAALGATPALAQSSSANSSSNNQSSSAQTANVGQTLQQDLEKAGFTNVHVMPEAYIVHAKNKQGNPVVMRVGPDTVTEVSELPSKNQTSGSSSKTSDNSSK